MNMVEHLATQGIKTLNQVGDPYNSTLWAQGWLSARALNLPADWHKLWHNYTGALNISHVKIQDREDELQWIHSPLGEYSPKEVYLFLYARKEPEEYEWWWKRVWKLKCPTKVCLFLWCLLKNKVLTRENLRRFLAGPSWCPLCKNAEESVDIHVLPCHYLGMELRTQCFDGMVSLLIQPVSLG